MSIEESKAMLHRLYHRFAMTAEETNVIAVGLERGLELEKLLSWTMDALENVQDIYPLNDCDCETCPECGKIANECTGTECAAGCSCSECDGCRLRAVIAAIKEAGIS